MMQIKADWCDLEDMIGSALRRMDRINERVQLRVEIAAEDVYKRQVLEFASAVSIAYRRQLRCFL